jgi:hypothetical protein
MNSPKFLITQYLEEAKDTGFTEEFRKTLYDLGVLTKDYIDEGLVLLYHKFDAPVTTELQRECRSLVIDRKTMKIVSYSCETPRQNKEGMEYLLVNPTFPQFATECFEGTLLSVFHHNDKWYVSTRRCLDSNESLFNNEHSHFKMFEEVIRAAGFDTFQQYSENLDKSNSYYFILIHHLNKHLIDYTDRFGPEYKKLCLTSIRDSNMISATDSVLSTDTSNPIFSSKTLDATEVAQIMKSGYNDKVASEGIVYHLYDETNKLVHLVKLQSNAFQFGLVVGTDRNLFKGLVHLYQNDRLVEYFSENQNIQNIKKITNPLNTSESYDTVGMIDAVFKVCTSETFELFKNLWSIVTGKHQNKDLYDLLPKEYKDLMFAIRGLYFKKKALRFSGDKNVDLNTTHLKISDVYRFLKSIPTDHFIALLRMRRLMFNWVKMEPTNTHLQSFSTVSKFCDKVHVKLTAIFTNKLFPNIMPNDVPPKQTDVVDDEKSSEHKQEE